MSYQEVLDYILSLADPQKAQLSKRFFKTAKGEYGFGDKFLGISVPVIRLALKKYESTSVKVAGELLQSEYHEVRLFALLLLVNRFSKAGPDEQKEIFHLYLANTKYVNNWDLVDSSAHYIVGSYLESRDKSILYDLCKSNSLWERRIAIMATFYFIKKKQFDETLNIAGQLLSDNEDLIHKAVGWMLREVGKRDLTKEQTFLKDNYQKMPRTMLRYAIEKFNKEERQKYLTGDLPSKK